MNYASLFEEAVDNYYDETALFWEGEAVSYGQLNARVNACANMWAGLGLGQQANVAVMADNSKAYLEVLFGCLKANITACLLNTRLSPSEIELTLKDYGIDAFVFERKYARYAEQVAAAFPAEQIKLIALDDACDVPRPYLYEQLMAAESSEYTAVEPEDGDTAIQLFTSGTTGKPKAIRHSHQAMVIFTAMYGYTAKHCPSKKPAPLHETFLCMLPLYHVSGVTALYALASGGKLVLQKSFSLTSFLQAIQDYRVSRTTVPQTVVSWMLEDANLEDFDLSSLVELAYGGSPISRRAIEGAAKMLDCALTQAYGSTEVFIATVLSGSDHLVDPDSGDERVFSVGRPMIGAEVKIVDRSGNACALGVDGEVFVRSPVTLLEYENGWVAMGDIGHLDQRGFLYLVGRTNDLIISGGENVFPAEIENCIRELKGDVADVAVVGVPDQKWGETPVAFVVRTAGSSLTEQDVFKHCENRIARYKRPSRIIFLETLPQDTLGKVSRKKLRSMI